MKASEMASEKHEMLVDSHENPHGHITAQHENSNAALHIQITSSEFGDARITSKPINGEGNWEAVSNFFRKSIIIGTLQLVCGVVLLIIDGVYMSGDAKDRKSDTSIVFGETLLCFLAAIFTFVAGRFSRMALHVTCLVFCVICAMGSASVAMLIAMTDVTRELGDAWNHVGEYVTDDTGMMSYIKTPEEEFLAIKNHHATLFIARCVFLSINAVVCIVQAAFCCRLTCCRPKIQVKIVYNVSDEVNQQLIADKKLIP
ncbi:uncharacterized protein LOC141900786 [Tubulanus polymorphus]|uniref:uncharacterized protein LOC141900786 n=1 Tax=Tubulanus polymorphus TaxID=672921 RepID=UPI003DA38344